MEKEAKKLFIGILIVLLIFITPSVYKRIKLVFGENVQIQATVIKIEKIQFNSHYTYRYKYEGRTFEDVFGGKSNDAKIGDCITILVSKGDPSNSMIEKFSCD